MSYLRDGAEIYRRSFALIRAEADLQRFSARMEPVAVRMIHACGMVDLAADIDASDTLAERATGALGAGAPILCDTQMVASGVTRSRLPAGNQVICSLAEPRVAALAREIDNTRTAAAVELWREHLSGSVVVIGNAPTALFYLLDMLEAGAPRPAAVIGVPVGFIGAAESKRSLADRAPALGLAHLVVHGRRGGSAIAAAAINALASETE